MKRPHNLDKESKYLFQYRVLAFVLFKDLDYIRFDPNTRLVRIEKMSAFSIELGYLSHRIRDGLAELQRLNIISNLKFAYNKASFYIEEIRLK